jgi:AcrR family transcriptional regulator
MRARKRALLEAAGRLFHCYGPHKTTIGDIARAAGVGVGTVYLEFPNKDAILLELSEAGHRSVLQAIEAAWSSPGPAEERLRRAIRARTEVFISLARHGVHGADLLHCKSCAPITKAHRAFRAAEEQLFAAFLMQGAREGVFSVQSPALTARALMWSYDTFSPPALFLRDERRLLADLESLHELVFGGLLSRL